MERTLKDYERIVVETDEENPTIIATITPEDIDVFGDYRVRIKPADVQEAEPQENIERETAVEDMIDFLAARLDTQEKESSILARASNYTIKREAEIAEEIDEMQITLLFAAVLASVGAVSGIAALILTIF